MPSLKVTKSLNPFCHEVKTLFITDLNEPFHFNFLIKPGELKQKAYIIEMGGATKIGRPCLVEASQLRLKIISVLIFEGY